jgi:DNA-binding transcriptional LysR family regulator
MARRRGNETGRRRPADRLDWLARGKVVPDRVLELNSYHAIVACAAAGTGIAVVPRSAVRAVLYDDEVSAHPLPVDIGKGRTSLVWRKDHHSCVFVVLRDELRRRRSR